MFSIKSFSHLSLFNPSSREDGLAKLIYWVSQYREGYWPPYAQLARLMEEVGELAREINHHYGPKKKKSTEPKTELADELADIVFTVAAMANSLKIDLGKVFAKSLAKYYGRDKNRWEKK